MHIKLQVQVTFKKMNVLAKNKEVKQLNYISDNKLQKKREVKNLFLLKPTHNGFTGCCG